VIVDIFIIVVSLFFGTKVLYNTQIGFISSSLVMIGSMFGYKKMVDTRVEYDIITTDIDKDVIEKLEDPYDLYSPTQEEDVEDIAKAIKEEKARLKANKRGLFQTLKDTKASLSIYRVTAYALLIIGFMYLNRHSLLHIPSYIIALGIPSIVVATFMMIHKITPKGK
jgi:hypothetical protein